MLFFSQSSKYLTRSLIVLVIVLMLVGGSSGRLISLAQDSPPAEATLEAAPPPRETSESVIVVPPAPEPTDAPTEAPSPTNTDVPTVEITEEPAQPTATEISTEATPEVSLPTDTPDEQPTEEEAATAAPTEPVIVPELPSEPEWSLLFEDHFDADDLSNWLLDSGWSRTPEGQLQATRSYETARLQQADLFNVAAQAQFRLTGGTARLIVKQSAAGSYTAEVDAAGQVNLYRGDVILQSVSVSPSAVVEWFTLRISLVEGAVRLSLNGQEIIALADPAPLPPGAIALSAVFAETADLNVTINSVQVDDVQIWVPADQAAPPTAVPTETPVTSETPVVPDEVIPAEPALTLLVTDNFDSGELYLWNVGAGWTLVPSEDGQALSATGESEALSFMHNLPLNNAAEARLLLNSGQAALSIRNSAAGSYTASLDSSGKATLSRGDAPLAERSVEGYAAEQWHTLRLSAIDDIVRVAVDGVEVIAIRDSAPLPPGAMTIQYAGDGVLLVDDVTLWVLDKVIPLASLEVSPAATSTPESDIVIEIVKPDTDTLSSDLDNLRKTWGTPRFDTTQASLMEIRDNQVRVMVIMLDIASADAAVGEIHNLGGEVVSRFETWIDAWVPIDALEQVAEIAGVSIVQSPIKVEPIPGNDEESINKQDVPGPTVLPPLSNMSSNIPGGLSQMSVAAPGAVTATFNSITRDRCALTIVFTVGDRSAYTLEIWDDGVQIYTKRFNAAKNQRISTKYTLSRPSASPSPDIGLVIRDSSNVVLAIIDPYNIPLDVNHYCANDLMTQGAGAAGAGAWNKQGWIGSGVNVAVLDSFLGYTTAQQRGELPVSIAQHGTLNLGSPHGTAVAEIIFDMAPGADLTFASPSNAVQMANYIADLSLTNDVISSSVGFYNAEPGDGTGVIANAVALARSRGAVYVQAAGNQANYNWQGQFRDADNDQILEYNNTTEVNILNKGRLIGAGNVINLFLRWNAWPTTNQDYDLYLMRWTGSQWATVAFSTTTQNGTQPPTESLGYFVPTTGYYGVVVHAFNANETHVIDLMGHNAPSFTVNNKSRSLVDPATPLQSFSVAAVNAISPYKLESYSSQGPTLGPGGSLAAGLDQLRIAGYANVRTWAANTFYGQPFNGTSAATPHVSGAAAIVLSAFPSFTPEEVIAFLENRAKDMGSRGYDHIYGEGRLWLGSSPKIGVPTITAPTGGQTNDATPTFSWSVIPLAVGYEVQVARDSAFGNIIQHVQTAGTSFTAASLPDGTYYLRVRAMNLAGFSGAWASKKLKVDTVAPAAPALSTPRDKGGVNNPRPTLTWAASPSANLYHLQVDDADNFSTPLVDITTGGQNHKPTSPLDFGRYYWRVQARDAAGNWSLWSAVRSFDITIMRAPRNGSWTTDRTPRFDWSKLTGATAYELEVATDDDFEPADMVFEFITPNALTYTVPNASALDHGIYYWRVNVDRGSGFEQSPVYWELIVTPKPLAAPKLLTPANNSTQTDTTPDFTWEAVTDGTNYEIQISRSNTFKQIVETSVENDLNFTPSALADGKYHWRVRTLNSLGVPGAWSGTRAFTIDS